MVYQIIGKELETKCGTLVRRYIENGKLYKSVSFYNSTNKIAKQKGLLERIVTYNSDRFPVEFTDTFERKTNLPAKERPIKNTKRLNLPDGKVRDTKETPSGTRYYRYIKNGLLYKHFWFVESTNKIAKQQGLQWRDVKYNTDRKPIECTDTFKRTTVLPPRKAKLQKNHISAPASSGANIQSDNSYFGTLGADSKESVLETYRKTDRRSVLYQDYDYFIYKVKANLKRFINILPKELYEGILNRYGTEEKSIRKIIQDIGFDIDKVSILPSQESLKTKYKIFINNTEKKEQEFAQIRLVNNSEKHSVAYTNAWTNSKLRVDMGHECSKHKSGNTWSILKEVWLKILNPEESKYKTENLIDSYLVQMYKNRYQTGILSYNGEDPLAKIAEDKEMSKKKVLALKLMYRGVRNLETLDKKVLKNPAYQEFKKSANTNSMAKTIENFEEHYKNAFLEYFWTDARKLRFSEVLRNEYEEFNEKINLSNDIYEALIKKEFMNLN